MAKPKRRVITSRHIIEPAVEGDERIVGYAVSASKNAFKNIRDGTVLTIIYDEDDRIIGVDLSGIPTADLQEELEDLLDKLESTTSIVVSSHPTPQPPRQQAQQ